MEGEVFLYRTIYYADMIMVKLLLEREGITYRIQDEHSATIFGLDGAGAIGGIKLFVRDYDYERAFDVLKENNFIHESEWNQDIQPELEPSIGKQFIKMLVYVLLLVIVIGGFFYWLYYIK